jgi:hypothetical protein
MTVHVKGDNFTKQDNPVSTNVIDMGEWGGKIRVQIDHYTTDATEVIGSTIKMAKLPVGARLLEAILYHGALGTSVTLDLGDVNDPNRYLEAADCAAAGVEQTRDIDLVPGSVIPSYKVLGAAGTVAGTDDQDVALTVGGATLATAIEITLITIYTQE